MKIIKESINYDGKKGSKSKTQKNKVFKIGLIGNPNSGKTSLFNRLTGSNQYVGNWPGVTVEKKEGFLKSNILEVKIIDLPGIYSLSPYSPEEVITRDFLSEDTPDLIVNIIDATNIERNLYLTTQLLELDCKVIIAVNMVDILKKKGRAIDYRKLSEGLNTAVVGISASKNLGIDNLIFKINQALKGEDKRLKVSQKIFCPRLEEAIERVSNILKEEYSVTSNKRFLAVKVIEDDFIIKNKLNLNKKAIRDLEEIKEEIFCCGDYDSEILIADQRYKYICKICKESVKEEEGLTKKKSISNKIDIIATGKYTAIPLFIILMGIIFYITFGPVGTFFKTTFENIINIYLGSKLESILNFSGASEWSVSLVTGALVRGVGAVMSFLPQVLILYTLLSVLEDSGYMTRIAFVMDRLLKKLGLSGKSFIPLLMGFGCSVPAVLGTRIIENKKDRLTTIFLIPFMSCSAKMPVYLLIASSFFPYQQSLVIMGIYFLGILVGILTAYIFKDSLFKGESSTFIMEMPEYKLPSGKNLWMHVWQKTKDFVERAGTVILLATILIWFLQSFDMSLRFVNDSSKSILAFMGGIIAPIFSVCGFGDWRLVVSLITGIIAKESVVSSMTLLYQSESLENLSYILTNSFSVYSALAFMVFVMLYTPCIAAVSAIHKEFESIKLTVFSVIYQIFIAFLFSALTFQLGTLISNLIR